MPGTDSQKQRRLPRAHKSGSMMEQNLVQSKSLSCTISNHFHLMFRHGLMSFIIDPVDFATIFHFSNDPPEIDHRPSPKIDISFWRL